MEVISTETIGTETIGAETIGTETFDMETFASKAIRALPANVCEQEAIELLSGGFASLFRPGLRRVASVYLPFQLFEVTVDDSPTIVQPFAIDLLEGNLDAYGFESDWPTLEDVNTRNRARNLLSLEAACGKALDRARRLIYQNGFFRLRNPGISVRCAGEVFHVPYWVGFYGDDSWLRIAVIDAVRRRREGAKVVEAITSWLRGGG